MSSVSMLERMISPDEVVQVDNTFMVTGTISWMDAVTKITGKKAYVVMDRFSGELLRSPSYSIVKPLVIGLNTKAPEPKQIRMALDEHVSKSKILIRDDWTCQYCFDYGNTIDHIMPKSRGGLNTWGNLCVACQKCNSLKRDRTPEESGMKNPKIPKFYIPPRRSNKLQKVLYTDLENMIK